MITNIQINPEVVVIPDPSAADIPDAPAVTEDELDQHDQAPAFVQPSLRGADTMPCNWDIKTHDENPEWVQAVNNVTGLSFEGPVKELSAAMRG